MRFRSRRSLASRPAKSAKIESLILSDMDGNRLIAEMLLDSDEALVPKLFGAIQDCDERVEASEQAILQYATCDV